jgi:hypothetical protein
MALILADVGADCFLKARFNDYWPASKDLTLRLFCNNATLADTTVASGLTQATGGGYAAKTLTCGSWVITPGNDPSDAIYPVQVFTFTGPLTTNLTIYGYYVTDDDGVLQWAEMLAAPFAPVSDGDRLSITAKFQLSKGTPT